MISIFYSYIDRLWFTVVSDPSDEDPDQECADIGYAYVDLIAVINIDCTLLDQFLFNRSQGQLSAPFFLHRSDESQFSNDYTNGGAFLLQILENEEDVIDREIDGMCQYY